jgi:hypothetical protein
MSTRMDRQGRQGTGPRRRNQMLGIGLVMVSVLVFATAIGIVVVLHEAQSAHVVAAG